MNLIRPLEDRDIPEVAELHHRTFHTSVQPDDSLYVDYFRTIFGQGRGVGVPSLVSESQEGRVTGFLGAVNRPIVFGGRELRAAISSQFIVEPGAGGGLTAIQMLKRFLDGPQDLSITDEASDLSRKLWTGLGGQVSQLQSVHWMAPLRPANCALMRLKRRFGKWTSVLAPAAKLTDAAFLKFCESLWSGSRQELSAEELDFSTLAALLPMFSPRDLRPAYDRRQLERIFDWRMQDGRQGRLQKKLLRSNVNETVGWYLLYHHEGEVAEVLQVCAVEERLSAVLDHLMMDATQSGCSQLVGRMEPQLVHAFSNRLWILHPRRYWMLFHSSRPELNDAFTRGDVCFSRVDGEWPIRFE